MKPVGRSGFTQIAVTLSMALVCQAPDAQSDECSNPAGLEALETCAASLKPHQIERLVKFGDVYFKGQAPATRPDKLRGIAFYRRAAEAGDPGAQLSLANALEETGAPSNQWLKWVEKSGLSGYSGALSRLQLLPALEKERVANDQTLREQYLQVLSTVLEQGRLSDDWYRTLAGLMGFLYERGSAGVSRNSQEAVRWYLRAAARAGFQSMWSALSIYKRGSGLPQDHKRAEQLLESFFRKQSSFFEKRPDVYIDSLYRAADLGFSSASYRLADIYEKGSQGVRADAAAAERWRKYGQRARAIEQNRVPDAATTAKAGPDAVDAKCESDTSAFVAQELRNQPVVTHAAHFNRLMELCLANVTLKAEPAGNASTNAPSTAESARAVIDVRGRRELAHYVPGQVKQVPLGCKMQTIRLRASFEMQDASCGSLVEYEAFVAKFMSD